MSDAANSSGLTSDATHQASTKLVSSSSDCSQGWSADSGNNIPRFSWLHRFPVLMVLAVLVALLFELLICNHRAIFFDADSYPERVIELPFNESLGRPAVVLTPQQKSLTINELNLPLNSVYIKTYGNPQLLNGRILLTDDARAKSLVPGNNFSVSPAGKENATDVFVFSNGVAHSLVVELTNINNAVAIEQLVLNQRPAMHFSVLRFGLSALALVLLVTIFKLRLYQKTIELHSRAYRAGTIGTIAFTLLLSWSCFNYINPWHTNPILHTYIEQGVVYQSTPNRTWLLDYPQSPDELGYHDIYIQQMDGWLKGQLNLDLPVDPKLSTLPNPYDISERSAAGVKAYYDRQFYDGKYYSYYGPAPIFTIYLPIYLITGMAPSPSLAIYLAALIYIAAAFFLCHVSVKTLKLRPNVLIFFTGEVAVIMGSLTLFNIIGQKFYFIAMPMAMAFASCAIACLLLAYHRAGTKFSKVMLVLSGLCVVLTVLTRPQMLLMALAFMLPFMFLRLKETCFTRNAGGSVLKREQWRAFIVEHLYLAVPVLIGAIGTMLYNYARFDHVLEFGQQYSICLEDSRYKLVRLSLTSLSHVLYFSFLQPYEYLKDFPYFLASSQIFSDYGNFHFFEITMGLLAIPLTYALVLIYPCLRPKSVAQNAELRLRPALLRTLGVCGILVIAFSFLIGYVEFHYAANAARYTSQLLYGWCLSAFILLCCFVHYGKSGASKLLYLVALLLITKTIVVGYFVAFSHMKSLGYDFNPDYLIELRRFFSPLLG